jgi:hypothetical protein
MEEEEGRRSILYGIASRRQVYQLEAKYSRNKGKWKRRAGG